MTMQQHITEKLEQALKPNHLEVINESPMHNVPPGSEMHFKVIIVSPEFIGLNRVAQHRLIHKNLSEELAESIHALSIKSYTPEEWEKVNGQTQASPPCRGGMAKEDK